jgi:hypothetical protein
LLPFGENRNKLIPEFTSVKGKLLKYLRLTMLNFHYPNALSINKLGIKGGSFPFSAWITDKGGFYHLDMLPIQIKSIGDVIERFSASHCVIFGVEHHWNKAPGPGARFVEIMTLKEVAEDQQMHFRELDPETLICPSSEFHKLSENDFGHYDWKTFDCAGELIEENILIDYCEAADWNGEPPLLGRLPRSTFCLYSHDDCYLCLETASIEFCEKLFERHLQFLAATFLTENAILETIPEVPRDLIKAIFSGGGAVTVFRPHIVFENGLLNIPFSDTPFKFEKDTIYHESGQLFLDTATDTWSLAKTDESVS